jgi:hypothetical protein
LQGAGQSPAKLSVIWFYDRLFVDPIKKEPHVEETANDALWGRDSLAADISSIMQVLQRIAWLNVTNLREIAVFVPERRLH